MVVGRLRRYGGGGTADLLNIFRWVCLKSRSQGDVSDVSDVFSDEASNTAVTANHVDILPREGQYRVAGSEFGHRSHCR